MNVVIFTDGGSRSNPGNAAIGVVALKDDQEWFTVSEYIGIATNNEAEYQGFVVSLEKVLAEKLEEVSHITWKLDSQLVVNQLNKSWKIKDSRMKSYAQQAWDMLAKLPCSYEITYVPRSENTQADALVNQALDAQAE